MDKSTNYSLSKSPLKDLIKEMSYYPNTKDFPNIINYCDDIEKTYVFTLVFPNYFNFIQNCDIEFYEYLQKSKIESNVKLDIEARAFIRNSINDYENEIALFIGEDWRNLRKGTKVHTTIFFALAYMMMPTQLSIYDKNILYWTILYHDVGKHQIINMELKEIFTENCEDKMHPFKSVYIFLKTFLKNNYIYFSHDEQEYEKEKSIFISQYDKFINTLFKSYSGKLSTKTKKLYYNLSYEYISDIESFLLFLREKPQNSWVYDITVLILFHQSLPNNDEHMNKPLLDEKYIKLFFNLRLLEMMRVVMVYDSSSHSLFKGGNWVKEINKNLDKLRLLFN